MISKSMFCRAAAVFVFWAAIAGAAFADGYADAVRQISAPPRAAGGSSGVGAAGWDGVSTERPTQNDAGAWIIKNEAQLAWFSAGSEGGKKIQDVDVVIQIDADLDLSGHDWTQIFGGLTNITVDGGGHVIKGLTKKSPAENFGLFGTTEGHFTASDLHLAGVDITSTQVGALLGAIPSGYTATIKGCTVQGKISSSTDGTSPATVGGLVGSAGGVTIERCVADVEIEVNGTGYRDVGGGLVGSVDGGACTINNSAVYGSVYVKGRAAGGIVGLISPAGGDTSSFENATNNAAVTLVCAGDEPDGGASFGAGGVIGVVHSSVVAIEASANYGTISASGAAASTGGDLAAGAGGIVGAIYGEDIMDIDNYILSIGMSANLGSVTSTINGTDSGGSPKLGAGGLVGTSYYMVIDPGSLEFQLSISRSRNVGAVTGNDTNSAGGMIGYLSTVGTDLADATTADISSSYNSGAVSALGGTAGGIVGSLRGEQMTGGGQNTYVDMSQVYSSVVPTGSNAYGFFGAYDNKEAVVAATDAKHTNGVSMAWPSEGGSYEADMNDRATFLDTDTDDDFWRRFLDNGVLPPELDRTHSPAGGFSDQLTFALRSASATRLANGDVAVRLIELPDGEVRASDAAPLTYGVSVGGNVIARDLRIAGGVLTIPANDSLVDGAVITITSSGSASAQSVPLALDFSAPAGGGEVRSISVRGAPIVPAEDTTIPLYLEWVDADGATHSDDRRPEDDPIITWSVIEPTAKTPNWDVRVAPTASDPYRADLTISKRKAQTPSYQEFRVQVRVSYGNSDDDIVYTRKFFAGDFPTQVRIGPEQQEMIDAANAVLARTNVALLPGNFQPVMSGEFVELLERRIANGLVNYTTDRAAAASDVSTADDPLKVYVLDDMSLIEALMTPTDPEPDTLPVCFTCTDKQAANVSLDISESKLSVVAPDAVGKIVLLPMTYSVSFESDDMTGLFGDDADAILAAPNSDLSLAKIFEVLVLHKRIKEGDMMGWYTRLVSGVATPSEARSLGMLEVDSDPAARELTVRLAYNVINYAGESFVISGQADGGSLGYIILPDGLYNGTLIDPLWPNIWKRSQGVGTGGGGGGCAAGAAAIIALIGMAMIKRGKR